VPGSDLADTLALRVQDAQLSQRDRAAGCVSFGQKWKTGIGRGDNILRTGRSSTTDIIGLPIKPARLSNSVKKSQNTGYYAVQGHSRSSRSVSIESPYATPVSD